MEWVLAISVLLAFLALIGVVAMLLLRPRATADEGLLWMLKAMTERLRGPGASPWGQESPSLRSRGRFDENPNDLPPWFPHGRPDESPPAQSGTTTVRLAPDSGSPKDRSPLGEDEEIVESFD